MTDQLRRLAIERRKRAVGGIMGHAEQAPWWDRLTAAEQRTFRDKVLSSINDYHDVMLDIMRISDIDVLVNEKTLEVVTAVRDSQMRLERTLAGHHG